MTAAAVLVLTSLLLSVGTAQVASQNSTLLDTPLAYTVSHDILGQRQMLELLYTSTNGATWSPGFTRGPDIGSAAATPQAAKNSTEGLPYLSTILQKCPWNTPGISYCQWAGVSCCLYVGESYERYCSAGLQSVAALTLPGINMTGRLPANLFYALPDLQLLTLNGNPGLLGPLPDAPQAAAAKFQIFTAPNTSLQQPCTHVTNPGNQMAVEYNGSCLPSWLEYAAPAAYTTRMSCPTLAFKYRVDTAETMEDQGGSSALDGVPYYVSGQLSVVIIDPLLFSYQGCTCVTDTVQHWAEDAAGTMWMDCIPRSEGGSNERALLIALPGAAALALILVVAGVIFRFTFAREWDRLHSHMLKRTHAPGTLRDALEKTLGLKPNEVTLVLTDAQGSTTLWECQGKVMERALAMHDDILRSLLPTYFGFEVTTEGDSFTLAFHDPVDAIGWAMAVQHALLEAAWPEALLGHPDAAEVIVDGRLLFRGLRVRMAMHTGSPNITVHKVTKQAEYHGKCMELTETLSHLPYGGQVLLSDTTFGKTYGRLHEVQLPAMASDERPVRQFNRTDTSPRRLMQALQLPLRNTRVASYDDVPTADGVTPASPRPFGQNSNPTTPVADSLTINSARIHSMIDTASAMRLGMREPAQLHAKLVVIDMGNHRFSEYDKDTQRAELPPYPGVHIVQILTRALAARALWFPPLDPKAQIAPSFFDAPGANTASMSGWPEPQGGAPANVTIAFCAPSGYKEVLMHHSKEAKAALAQYQSVVRTTLLLSNGYECQEKEGVFMVAFTDARFAVEWALLLQLALLRVDWSRKLLSLTETMERTCPGTNVVMFRGLAAKVGMFRGDMVKICPHSTAGRADYFGPAVNRAARFLAACLAGQVLAEASMLEEVCDQWHDAFERNQRIPAAAVSRIAVRNCLVAAHPLDLKSASRRRMSMALVATGGAGLVSKKSSFTAPSKKSSFRLLSRGSDTPEAQRFSDTPGVLRLSERQLSMHRYSEVHTLNKRGSGVTWDASVVQPSEPSETGRLSASAPSASNLALLAGHPLSSSVTSTAEQQPQTGHWTLPTAPLATAQASQAPHWQELSHPLAAEPTTHADPHALTPTLQPSLPGSVPTSPDADQMQASMPKRADLLVSIPSVGPSPKSVSISPTTMVWTDDAATLGDTFKPSAFPSAPGRGLLVHKRSGMPSNSENLTYPSTTIGVCVYALGTFAFKGLSEQFEVVQVYPSSLAPRMELYPHATQRGKAVRLVEKDELIFTGYVSLFDVLNLKLAADATEVGGSGRRSSVAIYVDQ